MLDYSCSHCIDLTIGRFGLKMKKCRVYLITADILWTACCDKSTEVIRPTNNFCGFNSPQKTLDSKYPAMIFHNLFRLRAVHPNKNAGFTK